MYARVKLEGPHARNVKQEFGHCVSSISSFFFFFFFENQKVLNTLNQNQLMGEPHKHTYTFFVILILCSLNIQLTNIEVDPLQIYYKEGT